MQINLRDLQNKLIMDFNYHDAKILNVTNNDNDVTILLNDGFNTQLDELTFINSNISYQFNLKNRIIYQLDDLVYFEKAGWHMSFLVWTSDNLLEKVVVESKNIISKKYQIKNNILDDLDDFEEKASEINNQIGEINVKKLQDKKAQKLLDKIFQVNEREKILSDINNYTLSKEENLNNEFKII